MPKTPPKTPVNPKDAPGDCPNAERQEQEIRAWWCRPYVVGAEDQWDVRVLDGGAWDRTTWHGRFASQVEAVEFAQTLHAIYWANLSSNELPLPFPYEQRLSPVPGHPGVMLGEPIGPAALVRELKNKET